LIGPAPPLQTRALVKRYGSRTALHALTLTLHAAEFVALLGPNGAGKSTLFQLLTGLFAADEGEIEIAGLKLSEQPSRALESIGVVFQQQALDLDLSAVRNWSLQADLQGLPRASARQRWTELAERLGLDRDSKADVDRPLRELSGGNRRKVELVRALLHRPSLLLMDEATVGLDPKSRRDLLAMLRAEVAERGASVLWATHWVEEAEPADRVLVLHQGRLLADGTPPEAARQLHASKNRAHASPPSLEQAFVDATA